MELLLIRHARPISTSGGDVPADPQLDSDGIAQADALSRWLCAEYPPDRLVASVMRRASETARAISQACGLEVEHDERLAEWDLGADSYEPLELAAEDLYAQLAVLFTTGTYGSHKFDPRSFRARVAEGMQEIARGPGQRVAVVCHGGVINSYLCDLLKRPYEVFTYPRYTSLSRVRLAEDGSATLISVNEVPHAALLPGDSF